ncbi:MAG: PaaI family thioesterase [Pseudomonadota bacterium]
MSQIRFANARDELPSRETVLSMSGLDFMQAMVAGTIPCAPIAKALDFRLHSVKAGEVTFRGAPQFDHMNPVGAIHGGWYGTLLDSAMGCAVMTYLAKGQIYTTLEYKVNLIRAIPADTLVDCTATSDHTGRSTGVAQGKIVGVDSRQLYATGSTTCIIMTPSDPPQSER